MRLRAFRYTFAACVAGILSIAPPAHAWGPLGHRVATLVAEQRLSAEARRAIRALLDPGETLADASLWADLQRDIPHSASWHYVNIPLSESRYSSRYCPPEGCVVGKVADFERVLRDPRASRAARQVALRFLIHAVEDLHQPLHVGNRGDRGGNDLQVRFYGLGTNLHQVWDFRVLERHSTSERRILAEVEQIAGRFNAGIVSGGNAADWASESLTLAREAYILPGANRQMRPGESLGDAYCQKVLPIAETRLAQAGIRLATLLNACLGQ